MAGTVHELEQKDLFWQVQSEAAKAAQQLVDQGTCTRGRSLCWLQTSEVWQACGQLVHAGDRPGHF